MTSQPWAMPMVLEERFGAPVGFIQLVECPLMYYRAAFCVFRTVGTSSGPGVPVGVAIAVREVGMGAGVGRRRGRRRCGHCGRCGSRGSQRLWTLWTRLPALSCSVSFCFQPGFRPWHSFLTVGPFSVGASFWSVVPLEYSLPSVRSAPFVDLFGLTRRRFFCLRAI